mgnify:CR=1 FL=1
MVRLPNSGALTMTTDQFPVKKTKSQKEQDLVAAIRRNPSTFTELLALKIVSRTVLSEYLDRMENEEKIIKRQVGEAGRIEYTLSEKGKTEEENRQEAVPAALELMKFFVQEPDVTRPLLELSNWAKKDPSGVQVFMREFDRIMKSDDAVKLIARYGGRKGAKKLKQDLMKRIRFPPNLDGLTSDEKIRVSLSAVYEAIVEMSTETRQRTPA